MPDITQDTFTVTVGDDVYTFRAPGIKYRFEVSGRASDIRRKAYPEGVTNERLGIAVDWGTDSFSRACAVMELYLIRATVPWPYGVANVAGVDFSKPPRVDFEKFPPGCEDTVDAVGAAFVEELARFRKGGDPNGPPPVA